VLLFEHKFLSPEGEARVKLLQDNEYIKGFEIFLQTLGAKRFYQVNERKE